jgi:hypothetical protein
LSGAKGLLALLGSIVCCEDAVKIEKKVSSDRIYRGKAPHFGKTLVLLRRLKARDNVERAAARLKGVP